MIVKYRHLIAPVTFAMLALLACSPSATEDGQEPPPQEPLVIDEATSSSPTGESAETSGVPSSGGAIDACVLITQAEAEAVLGEATGPGQRDDAPPIYSCSYQTSDFDVVSVVVLVYDDNLQAQAGYQMAIDINAYPEITGVGDRAYNAQPIFDVNVLSGNVEVSVDISDATDDATQLRKSIDLARLVLNRLP